MSLMISVLKKWKIKFDENSSFYRRCKFWEKNIAKIRVRSYSRVESVFLDFINSSQQLKRFVPLRVKDRHGNASRAWYRSRVGRIGCAHVTWLMWNTRGTACSRRRLNARDPFSRQRARDITSVLGRVEGRSARLINQLFSSSLAIDIQHLWRNWAA